MDRWNSEIENQREREREGGEREREKDFILTWNQSIVQQLTREGNLRRRLRKESPMGDMAKHTWSWSRTREMNRLNKATGEPSVCLVLSRCLCTKIKGDCSIKFS